MDAEAHIYAYITYALSPHQPLTMLRWARDISHFNNEHYKPEGTLQTRATRDTATLL